MFKKSLLTIILAACVGFMSAQSLRFEHEGTVYANNDVVICTELSEWGSELLQHMEIRNMTERPISVVIEKVEISLVPGSTNSFCWGNCYGPDTFISPIPVELAGGALSGQNGGLDDLSFHHLIDPNWSGDPSQYVVGTSVVQYYAYPENNPSDRVMIEVWFAYNAETVAEISNSFGHAYPNPATSQVSFNYTVNSSDDVMVSVYNLLGQEVKSQRLSSTDSRVVIATDGMQSGIYFCSFSVDGQVVATEKFIVKK